jgi:hypothetical protein
MYKELAMNADKMTELYKETAESTEEMSKYWLNYISCTRLEPLSENKEQKKKQEYGENIRKGA